MAVRLSALSAGRPLPARKIPGPHLCYRLSQPQGHSAAERIWSIEKSNDLIGNRNHDLSACRIVPQPSTLPCAPHCLSMTLQPFVGPRPLFSFLILYTVSWTPWTGDQPVARPLHTRRTTQTQNKRI
jgi:hypothetical protein